MCIWAVEHNVASFSELYFAYKLAGKAWYYE